MQLQRAFRNLTFERLTDLAQPGGDPDRLFVTEQSGRILAFASQPQVEGHTVFLDISNRVSESHNEEGLLGLVFDPNFSRNGFFYVYYSAANPRRSVVSRFSVDHSDADRADADSELVILEIPQPYGNHNGGQVAFGPEGYLYIALGDGGSGGDPQGNGQNTATLLGSILRIDVSSASEDERYRIPPDNPFVGTPGSKGEIWAYGLRNPWRFSFDMATGLLWAGDVGQAGWEEIDLIQRGLNYGWKVMEGAHCYAPSTGCNESGLQFPLVEYNRSDPNCAVVGGYVYRGAETPSLTGAYVYGDYCAGTVWGLRYDGLSVNEHVLLADSGLLITSFGQDQSGEVYVLSRNSGIYHLASQE